MADYEGELIHGNNQNVGGGDMKAKWLVAAILLAAMAISFPAVLVAGEDAELTMVVGEGSTFCYIGCCFIIPDEEGVSFFKLVMETHLPGRRARAISYWKQEESGKRAEGGLYLIKSKDGASLRIDGAPSIKFSQSVIQRLFPDQVPLFIKGIEREERRKELFVSDPSYFLVYSGPDDLQTFGEWKGRLQGILGPEKMKEVEVLKSFGRDQAFAAEDDGTVLQFAIIRVKVQKDPNLL